MQHLFYVLRMSKKLQIRNVPEELHRVLKSRAAAEGVSLSDYMRELRRSAQVPTMAEMRERLRNREPVDPGISMEEAVRAERDSG